MVNEVRATDNIDRQMYVIVHFLGRLAVWQHLYPDVLDSYFINKLMNGNPWMEELYYFLIKYDKLEDVYLHFDEMEDILEMHFCE